jgi:TonB-dependent SusC/RagA subfamily outer membrane receptor
MFRSTFMLAVVLLTSTQLWSQNRVVYGKLITFNRFPISNVKVVAKKSEASALSDSMGMFSIVCQKKDVLKIKPEAFQPVTRRVGPGTDSLVINLVFVDSESNRKVATGYGYIDEKDLTYAVSNLDHENNDFCNYPDIYTLMKGKLAGVTVSGGAVFIRGVSSLTGSSEALLVVDGMIVNDISWINPCHVRSIDALKDSSASMYGSRGANGVVVIKTKTGV